MITEEILYINSQTIMANESGNTHQDLGLKDFLSSNGIDLKNISDEDQKKIAKQYSISQLLSYMKDCGDEEKTNILSIIEKRNKMDEDERTKLQETEQKLKKIDEEKEKQRKLQGQNVAALKNLLKYDENNNGQENNEQMNTLLEVVALNGNNKDLLDEIKNLQEDLGKADTKEKESEINGKLAEKKKELRGLIGQKDNLYYQYFGESFDDNNGRGIQEFKRRGKIFGKGKNEETGQTVRGIMNPIKAKRIARMRLNRVIRKMNDIGKDSTLGMKMVMNRCHLNGVRPIRRGMKDIANTFRLRDPKKFSKYFNEQKQEFITDLIGKISEKELSKEDKNTIKLIEKRLDRYKEDYKRKFLQM